MAGPLSNDALTLVPRTVMDGPALAFDFPGLQVGVAEYEEGPTGCTVILVPKGAALAIDVRGGSVGLTGGDYTWTHAICLAGGSLYGLEAASGVSAELFAQRAYATRGNFALVSGAIIYDFHRRDTAIYPDKALGRAAVRAAREGWFPLGPRGAGRSAGVGGLFSERYRGEACGQGASFGQFGPLKVAVFTVVNATGAIVDRSGTMVRGCLDPATGERAHPLALAQQSMRAFAEQHPTQDDQPAAGPTENTTLTVLVTNLKLGPHYLRQFGRQVHTSMARAIQPFQTQRDGDVLFALSTNEVEIPNADGFLLAIAASELAWDAVLASY
jgi:L-aminopeptidase/D-esterase-like protein